MTGIHHQVVSYTQIHGHILPVILRLTLFSHGIEPVPDNTETTLRINILKFRNLSTPGLPIGQRNQRPTLIFDRIEISQGDIPMFEDGSPDTEQLQLERTPPEVDIIPGHGKGNHEFIAEDTPC